MDTYWRGIPTAQCPTDLWVTQEIVVERSPTLIVECGGYYGGQAAFLADLGVPVVSIDVEPRGVPYPGVTVITGSSTDPNVVDNVTGRFDVSQLMVILDSDHRKNNVLAELNVWGPLVAAGQYLVCQDTNLGWLVEYGYAGDGPLEALAEWLPEHPEFRRDPTREKHGLTMYPGGWLERIR
jgi:cephalosporin hydroxylase